MEQNYTSDKTRTLLGSDGLDSSLKSITCPTGDGDTVNTCHWLGGRGFVALKDGRCQTPTPCPEGGYQQHLQLEIHCQQFSLLIWSSTTTNPWSSYFLSVTCCSWDSCFRWPELICHSCMKYNSFSFVLENKHKYIFEKKKQKNKEKRHWFQT